MTAEPVEPSYVATSGGATVALHDLGGEGPPLLLCHPTGFHGRVWEPVAVQLGDMVHGFALDFRGHGDSTLPSGPLEWEGFGDDVLATVDLFGWVDAPLVGVGHSMGGAALLMAEQMRPGTFSALWCFEPIVFPALPDQAAPGNPLAEGARRRRAVFADRDAALANYAIKPPLGGFAPEALEAYVQHGFRDLPDGQVELKCAPEVEAQVFEGAINNGIYERLEQIECPVTVAASGDGGYPAQVATSVADLLPAGRLERFAELSHFGPQEAPARIADAIRKIL